MRDFSDDLKEIRRRVEEAHGYLKIDQTRARLTELEAEVQRPDLWDDQDHAKAVNAQYAAARDDVTLVTPVDAARRAGIVSLRLADALAASARLRAAGVAHSVREGAVRLSPHGYNSAADVDRALGALDEHRRAR